MGYFKVYHVRVNRSDLTTLSSSLEWLSWCKWNYDRTKKVIFFFLYFFLWELEPLGAISWKIYGYAFTLHSDWGGKAKLFILIFCTTRLSSSHVPGKYVLMLLLVILFAVSNHLYFLIPFISTGKANEETNGHVTCSFSIFSSYCYGSWPGSIRCAYLSHISWFLAISLS